MERVTQANAAQTEELTATAQALASQAEHMQNLVGRFKLTHHDTAIQGRETPAVIRPIVKVREAKAMPKQAGPLVVGDPVTSGMRHGMHQDYEEFWHR